MQAKKIFIRLAGIPGSGGNALWVDEINLSATVAQVPKISLNKTAVDFGNGDIDGKFTDITLDISNTGTKEMNLWSIMLEDDLDGVFKFTNGTSGKIPASTKRSVTFSFAPKKGIAKTWKANISIRTDDPNNEYTNVPITGTTVINSVNDGIAGSEGEFTMSVFPNPINNFSTISYNVFGDAPKSLTINLVDISGAVVANIVNSTLTSGSYKAEVKANGLAAGTYYLIANVGDYKTQLPVVIVK